ncbi:SAM-dependent methyltransferase [Elioraea tepidiphila]|jgi:23S rRNA (cytidine2498-2'-O)-methyltransferase|uniref:SAM-dependent methyltransferase n=1 Tax=Elioraea tepidiphila TaxID=457934 RepID=UPI0003645B3C|nr:SAM-dependent methyltransferase [Elioraea tepidiphila]
MSHPPIAAGYLAAEGFERPLAEELARRGVTVAAWHGRLALSPDPPVTAAWALNTWRTPRVETIASIADAAARLRAVQRNWAAYAPLHHRRATLIAARLPHVSAKPIAFPAPAPTAPLGSWTLLDPTTLLASRDCTSPFPNGEARFVEDRTGPPSRAYLKLWETLCLLRRWPAPGETCLDLGAAPGGWTWALAELGARVVAVDKAPLDPTVAALPGVSARRASAFGLDPAAWRREHGPADWLFSDVIAYPARLLRLVRAWIAAEAARNIVCTLKFQGETDHAAAEAFAAIPGAWLRHVWHNKHELMFARLAD